MQNVIIRLQQLVSTMPERLQLFSAEEMTHRPAPGKWSKREIIGHLCDSALHNWQRFTYIQRRQEGPFIIATYPQDELVRLNNYQQLPTGQIVNLWASLNTQIVGVLKNMPAEKISHPIVLPNGEKEKFLYLVQDYLDHLEHHLRQVFPDENIAPPALPHHWHIPTEAAMEALSKHPGGKPFITLLEKGKMYVEIYQPNKVDLQKPHDQDEIYVVINGSGTFYNNGERRTFQPGDLLFVPAGIEHRFEDFSEDFKTWIIFY
ncbi:MAG: cupin domain-containing protein [Lewinellaceae bacterium]|nr:cupin domain-containing protein [Saprospiraceae bacterium]MCB9339695.1 cupin domain-containing protein [Lewinellaceae bacterium]